VGPPFQWSLRHPGPTVRRARGPGSRPVSGRNTFGTWVLVPEGNTEARRIVGVDRRTGGRRLRAGRPPGRTGRPRRPSARGRPGGPPGLPRPHRSARRRADTGKPRPEPGRNHELRARLPARPDVRVAHETVHRALPVQGRGGPRRELTRTPQAGRAVRRPTVTRQPADRVPRRVHRDRHGRRPGPLPRRCFPRTPACPPAPAGTSTPSPPGSTAARAERPAGKPRPGA
jgi:hypothetical protein